VAEQEMHPWAQRREKLHRVKTNVTTQSSASKKKKKKGGGPGGGKVAS